MTSYIDPAFRDSLLKKPHDRTAQDLTLINANLKSLEALSSLRDTTIRSLCKTVRYEKHEANDVLYRTDDIINCWYILLSGSVFIDGSMFLPRSGFGRRSVGQSRRIHDCLVLETSEMIVIDYPHLKQQQQQPQQIEQQQQQQISTVNIQSNKSNAFNQELTLSSATTTATSSSSSISSSSIISKINNSKTNNSKITTSTAILKPLPYRKTDLTADDSLIILNGNVTGSNGSGGGGGGGTNDDLNNNIPLEEEQENNHYQQEVEEEEAEDEEEDEESENREDSLMIGLGPSNHLNNKNKTNSYCFVSSPLVTNSNNRKKKVKPPSTISNVDYYQNVSNNKSICLIHATKTTNNHKDVSALTIGTTNTTAPIDSSTNHQRHHNNRHHHLSYHQEDDDYHSNNKDQHKQNHHKHSHSHAHNLSTGSSSSTTSSSFVHSTVTNTTAISNQTNNNHNASIQKHSSILLVPISNPNTSINSVNSVNNHNHNATTTNNSSSLLIGGDDVSSSDLQQSIQNMLNAKDIVRDVLEKDPKERTDEDIDILFEFMQSFPAFTDLTPRVIRKLCACMVLGVVDKSDTLVLDNHEKLDSWAVVLNGSVECTLPNDSRVLYNVGDHFGVTATLDPVYHEGVMRTKCDDCQFVLVKQNDYYEILNKSKENLNTYIENGKSVLITEDRQINESTEKTSEIVLKGTVEKLTERLVYDDSYSIIDPTYIQDFLLTYRVFCDNPVFISGKLLEWFQINKSYLNSPKHKQQLTNATVSAAADTNSLNNNNLKKKVYRIVLEWITNHFNDFETNRELYEFVERFQEQLNREKMLEQFRVLTIAISTKSKQRTLTLARSKRDESLMFSIQGGWEKGYGIFVSKVDKETKAYELGIRKGDQILEVNGQSFQHISLLNALDTLKSLTHLSITLKYNPIGFNEMLLHPDKSPYRNKKNLVNNDKQYLIEYLQKQQNQLHQSLNSSNNKREFAFSATEHLSGSSSIDRQLTVNVKKSIGSIPPLPPSSQHSPSANGTITSSTSNMNNKHLFMNANVNNSNSNSTSSSNSKIHSIRDPSTSSASNHLIGKMFGHFKKKAHSKDLESLQQMDASAPSLKSITRSPSPSLSTFAQQQHQQPFNRSTTITSINSSATDTISSGSAINFGGNSNSCNLIRNNSLSNINLVVNNETPSNGTTSTRLMTSSLASISLQEQQQFAGEHVLKIYKNDQTFKYLVVHKETSTKEVVMLALNEFNIVDDMGSNAYSLCEVSVDQDRLIKQKRLPDQMNNLADKLPLNARYYLKSNTSPEQFLSDSFSVEELIKDATVTFLQLDPLELSAQLTLRDYCIFKSIESSEYIDYYFKKSNSKYGYSHLTQFSDLSNEEMFWVVNEILHESNLVKRAKIIKLFIQIAHICKECKNFNSLLAILQGLDHLTVARLKDTWEKVPNKYKKILEDLRILLDTSKNMLKYRQVLKSEFIQPPIIPFFPICQKDLYFIKESGETKEDGLINFDKLRKFSKGVRSIVQMTCSSFDLTSLKDVPTSHSVIFTMFGCTNPNLIESFKSGGVGIQFTKQIIKPDHIKKLYEESVMVRKVRHYLNGLSKNIEKNEERLRMISSALEHSVSVNTTLRRKPSPNNSLGGSVSSINGLNNSNNLHNLSNGSSIGAGTTLAGITCGNGALNNSNGASGGSSKINAATLFGTHSPDAVKKLLALSESKSKTVKNSASSTSVPISHMGNATSNSRLLLNTSGNSSNVSISNYSAHDSTSNSNNNIVISPKSKHRSVSSSQPIHHSSSNYIANKYNNTSNNNNINSNSNNIALSSESSSVSTIKLSGKFFVDSSYSSNPNSYHHPASSSSSAVVTSTGLTSNNSKHINNNNNKTTTVNIINLNGEPQADSGRASMASNIDQDQCSPTFQQRTFTFNRYLMNEQQQQSYLKSANCKFQSSQNQQFTVSNNKMPTNVSNSNKINQNSLEEEDQVSAV